MKKCDMNAAGWLIYLFFLIPLCSVAQEEEETEDLLDLLGEDTYVDYTIASFKANRVINLQSLEVTAKKVLDIKISHRLGLVSGGIHELFGLDQAQIRLGADYGVTDRLTVGGGRSSYEKTYDGFLKYKFLRQSSGARKMPVSALFHSSMAIKTIPFSDPERENYFSSRLYYTFQLIVGRKFSNSISLQVSPTLIHRNLVANLDEKNDVFALGGAGRVKMTQRLSLNFEYIYLLPDQVHEDILNSASLGVDIETGGHVFQLHFTNSTSMIDKGFFTETTGDWLKGDIRFGFNVSRVFNTGNKSH